MEEIKWPGEQGGSEPIQGGDKEGLSKDGEKLDKAGVCVCVCLCVQMSWGWSSAARLMRTKVLLELWEGLVRPAGARMGGVPISLGKG